MKKLFTLLFAVLALTVVPPVLRAQQASESDGMSSSDIPTDPNIKKGTFDNGLSYYIRHNDKPQDEIQLRLVVRAGSILENDNQRGLAHVMEHMNFNGTTHFKKNELVDYLQSIGVKFGADLNAYTSFGQTVYILPLPTDSTKALNRGFQVLEDWAHEARLQDQQIDDERGVVLEEYRLGLGAGERMQKQYLPVILKDSRYAKRLPIGTKDNIENFDYSDLRSFYHDWYRPELMGVIAVGDLPADELYQKVKQHFAGIKPHKNPPKRKSYSIPNHKKTYIAVASDSEATSAQVQLTYQDKGERKAIKTTDDYRHDLVERLFSEMINNRLDELRNSPNPPFVFGFSNHGQYWSPNKEAYRSFAVTKQDGALEGLEALLVTNKKVKKYGFHQNELDRAKKDLLASLKNSYKGRETHKSTSYVREYLSNYLYDEPIPGITWEYQHAQKMLPAIKLKEVSSLIDHFLHKNNRSVLVTGPPMAKSHDAMKSDIKKLLAKVEAQKVTPYESEDVRDKLMMKKPKMGAVTNESTTDKLGTTTLKLSNGAKVVYKKTDFKDNQILFRAYSPGGSSLYSDDTYRKTALANGGLDEAGVAGLSKTDLKKVMAGKTVSVSPYINSLTEGMRGNAAPEDLETLFQLVNQYFTSLNKDPQAFKSYISRQKAQYANLLKNPQFYYISQLQQYINGHNNPRYVGLPTPEKLDAADYNLAYQKYQQRFKNAGDFTFYFVGDIPTSKLKTYAKMYLAGLPATDKRENYNVLPYRPLSGDHEKTVHKGKAPKSLVNIIYEGETEYSPEKDYDLEILGDILTIKLTENLREKESGVYTISARGGLSKVPYGQYRFSIGFPCGPDNVKRLKKSALAEVQKIIENGPTDTDLEKVKKHQRLAYKKDLKKNSYWLSQLYDADFRKLDKTAFLNKKQRIDALTKDDIQQVAKQYLTKGHITGILYPADQGSSEGK